MAEPRPLKPGDQMEWHICIRSRLIKKRKALLDSRSARSYGAVDWMCHP